MQVILFALTGFGNKILDALLSESCQVKAVFTRAEKGPFPYYPEENLTKYANSKDIKVYENFSWQEVKKIIEETSLDLLLVTTFHRIIPEKIISLVPLCINIHPSLLPKYRGATPTEWVLKNKEPETGVTAHFLTKEMDAGDILIQKKILVLKDDNNKILRKKLALLAAQVVKELIDQIRTNKLNPVPQDESQATYFPNYFKNR